MKAVDPIHLAARQIELDRAHTTGFAGGAKIGRRLFDRKVDRMSASPLAFLRGAAPIFYEILAQRPDLAKGPDGEGWIVGDLHLENFGAYHPGGHARGHEEIVAFDLNDFDDAVIAPWRFDLIRLTTSLILGGRELGASGTRVIDLSRALLDAYVRAAFGRASSLKGPPKPVADLLAQVSTRTRHELLAARTEDAHGTLHFVRGDHYLDLPRAVTREVPAALARFATSRPKDDRPDEEQLALLDAALRIAGTGSLGALRIAALVQGKGGHDGAWIFDLKEQGDPSACVLVPLQGAARSLAPSERVVTAFRACVANPPRFLGTTTIANLPMFVRRLAPQEDKLDLTRIHDRDLDALATYLGTLVGRAHRRAATKPPRNAWRDNGIAAIVERAIVLAGIHEATYLAYCKAVRT